MVRQASWTARVALLVAAALSVALVVLTFTYPLFEGFVERPDGTVEAYSRTAFEDSGTAIVALVLIPLAVTVLVALALLRAPQPAGRVGAWLLIALLLAFAVVMLLSIGLYVLPVVAALAVAAAPPRQVPQPKTPVAHTLAG